jgi:hypothetical protein
MPQNNVAALVHLVGFLIGAALYGMLFGLAVWRRAPTGTHSDIRDDRVLPLVTAVLGLIWNLTGLAAFAIRDFAGHEPDPLLIATAYSALGFLPAVVVHLVLRSQADARHRLASTAFIWSGYAISTIGEAMMFWSAEHGGIVPSAAALQILMWSSLALTVPVLVLTRRRSGSARGWSIVALAVFAVTALHLSHLERSQEGWLVELIGHHASIPLIFAILYQDFRFALADLFLKRALALSALVTIAAGVYLGVEVPVLARHDFRSDPVAVGVSVSLWVGVALIYPLLQRWANWIIDRLVLHRVDYARLREETDERVAELDEAHAVMDAVADALRHSLAGADVRWMEGQLDGPGIIVPIPTTEMPRYAIVVGALSGGRRLLSDEIVMFDDLALLAARRIDAIRLTRERYERSMREQEMSKLTTEAELRALRAQVNPHFLFNALNTLGYLIQTSPRRAEATLMKLTSLLRGMLRSTETTTTLGDEIDLVSAYLEIERARFEDRLHTAIQVPVSLRGLRVPPLLLQPLVENAIKHGIANCRGGGSVAIEARADRRSLTLTVRNTGAPTTDLQIAEGRKQGVGLANLDARLRHQYGEAARLMLVTNAEETRSVVVLPLSPADAQMVTRAG